MDNDDFAERLRNRELARTDQREARDKIVEDEQRARQTTRSSVQSAFDEMRSYAEGLIPEVNAKVANKFMELAGPRWIRDRTGQQDSKLYLCSP